MSPVNISNGIVPPPWVINWGMNLNHCHKRNLNKGMIMFAKLIRLEALDLVKEERELRKYCVKLIWKYQKRVLEKYGKTVERARTKGAFAVNLREITLKLQALVEENSLDEAKYLHYFTRLYRLYLEIAFNAKLPGERNISKEDHLFNILEYGKGLFTKNPARILDAFLTATLEPQDRIDMLCFAMTFPQLFTSSHESFYKFLTVARVIRHYYISDLDDPEIRDKLDKVCESVTSTHSKLTSQFMDYLRIKRPSKIIPGLQMTPVDIVNSLNSKRVVMEAQDSICQMPEERVRIIQIYFIDPSRDEVQSSSGVREIILNMDWNGYNGTEESELQEVKKGKWKKIKLKEVEGESQEEVDKFADVLVERPPEDPKDENVDVATAPIPPALELEKESDIEVIGECFLPNPPEGADEKASEPERSYDSSENPPNYNEDSSNFDSEKVEEEQEETEVSSEEGDKSEKDEVDSDDDIEMVKTFSPMKIMPSPTQEGGSQGRDQEIEKIVSKFTEAIAKSNILEPSSPKERELRSRAAPKGVQTPKVKQLPPPKVEEPLPKVSQPRPTSSMLSTLVPLKKEAPVLRTRRNTAANKHEVEMEKDEEIPSKRGKMTRKTAEHAAPKPAPIPIEIATQNKIAPPKRTVPKPATLRKTSAPAKGLASKKAQGKPKKKEVKKAIKSSTKAKEEAPKPDQESTAPTKYPAAEKKEVASKGKGKRKKSKNDAPGSGTITTRSLRSSAARKGSIAGLT